MLLPNRDPRIGELSDRIDNPRLREGVLLYLASVGLVAAAIIVLFSIASFSLLGTTKETLTGSRIDNNPIEDVSIDTAVFYSGNITPVPVPTKLPSSSEATNLPSATLVPPPSGMSGERTTVEPALKPLPHGETSAMAVETPHGSTRGPPTEEASPPEPSGSQQVIAEPLSIADEASATQHASGATMPSVATSDGEPDQKSQNFEIQRDHQANLEEGSAAFTLENRFPENQVKESMGFYGSAASAGSDPPLLHATSRGRRAI
jgi:cytoskeletal protein RodZ